MAENHPKIINSIDIMISDAMLGLQYYGEFCQYINFKQSHSIRTCGVTVDVHGMKFLFNSEFVDNLTQEEINFVMLHEVFHLLWDHQSRSRRCGYDHELSNVVQDMIINDVIKTDIIDKMKYNNKQNNRTLNFAEMPVDRETNKVWVLHKPEEYKGNLSFEEMFEWITIEKNKYDNWKKNCKCDKELNCKCNKMHGKEPCECPACPVSDYLRKIFDQMEMGILEWLDCHLPCDLPVEYRKSIIENVKNALKNRGLLSGDIQSTLDKITKSKKDYIKDIKIGINELFGTFKQKSMTKRNRRGIQGVKGKRKDSYSLNVLLDVSGSMNGYFEKALSYIFQNGIVVNIVQCDTEVKDYTVIKNKNDFRSYTISGLGGTVLQPGINYIVGCKKINKLNTLILTDGMTDELDVTHLNRCMIISHGHACKVIGNARQIVIKD
jgi:predicted metal-dependent peptidase